MLLLVESRYFDCMLFEIKVPISSLQLEVLRACARCLLRRRHRAQPSIMAVRRDLGLIKERQRRGLLDQLGEVQYDSRNRRTLPGGDGQPHAVARIARPFDRAFGGPSPGHGHSGVLR